MKLKNVDGELYLDRETKVFFRDDILPEEFKDASEYDIVIIDSDRPLKLELYKINENQLLHQKDFYTKEELEQFMGADIQEHFAPDMTYIVLCQGGFVGCFSN